MQSNWRGNRMADVVTLLSKYCWGGKVVVMSASNGHRQYVFYAFRDGWILRVAQQQKVYQLCRVPAQNMSPSIHE